MCAVGGNPSRALLPSDIAFHACTPVLAALKTDTTNIKALSGIRVRARVYLDEEPEDLRDAWLDVVDPEFEASYQGPEERGEVLFRDWGISGIAVFDMSRYVEPGQMVFLDLLPDMEPQDKVDFIWEQSMAHPSRTAAEVMSGLLPSRVARAVVVAGGLNPDEPIIAEQEAVVLAMVSESFGLSVRGIADPKQAQVTRGGFATECFDAHTFECREHAGLFACGEALDVDGRCGGYNLHWAWTSGLLAGASAAMSKMLPRVLSRGFRWARSKVWRNALVAQRFRAMKAVATSVRAASARAAKAAFVLPANAATAYAAAKRGAMRRPAARRAVEAPMRATSVAKARTVASAARVASEAMLAPLVPKAATMAGKGPTGARS